MALAAEIMGVRYLQDEESPKRTNFEEDKEDEWIRSDVGDDWF